MIFVVIVNVLLENKMINKYLQRNLDQDGATKLTQTLDPD